MWLAVRTELVLLQETDLAKPKNPLLSLSAHGSLGGAITFQERHQQAFVRKKPIPRQPNTLAQLYHRWDYQDYAYLWHALSAAEKQQYESDARRSRITGFNLWMRVYLNTLPDLAGRWHLDELSGATAYDSSKNTNNGTIYGTTPAIGRIDGCRFFDGIDDYIDCGADPSLMDIFEAITLECFVYPTVVPDAWDVILTRHDARPYSLRVQGEIKWQFIIRRQDNTTNQAVGNVVSVDQRTHLVGTYDGTDIKLYENGDLVTTTNFPGTMMAFPTNQFGIGSRSHVPDRFFKGYIDEARVYNRVLTLPEIKRHAERRYPL